MKQKDLALIGVVVFISIIVSVFISKAIFNSPKNREQQVDKVQQITSDFPQPDTSYFNKSAFDPAQPITIGQNSNTNPFSGSAQ